MTYGVPYSFVPGTKARADEVNANFIDILDKIADTNTRIDEANTNTSSSITELETNKADLSLSNINSTAKNLFDGSWVHKYSRIVSEKDIAVGASQTYSLENYLPNDENKYEIILSGYCKTQPSSGSTAFLSIKTDFITSTVPMFQTLTSSAYRAFDTFGQTLISSTGRSITVTSGSNSVNTANYDLRLHGYRRVK